MRFVLLVQYFKACKLLTSRCLFCFIHLLNYNPMLFQLQKKKTLLEVSFQALNLRFLEKKKTIKVVTCGTIKLNIDPVLNNVDKFSCSKKQQLFMTKHNIHSLGQQSCDYKSGILLRFMFKIVLDMAQKNVKCYNLIQLSMTVNYKTFFLQTYRHDYQLV